MPASSLPVSEWDSYPADTCPMQMHGLLAGRQGSMSDSCHRAARAAGSGAATSGSVGPGEGPDAHVAPGCGKERAAAGAVATPGAAQNSAGAAHGTWRGLAGALSGAAEAVNAFAASVAAPVAARAEHGSGVAGNPAGAARVAEPTGAGAAPGAAPATAGVASAIDAAGASAGAARLPAAAPTDLLTTGGSSAGGATGGRTGSGLPAYADLVAEFGLFNTEGGCRPQVRRCVLLRIDSFRHMFACLNDTLLCQGVACLMGDLAGCCVCQEIPALCVWICLLHPVEYKSKLQCIRFVCRWGTAAR